MTPRRRRSARPCSPRRSIRKALQDPAPLVVLNNYQDSSIQYLLMLWTASGDYLDVRFAVNEAVKRELDARGIAIPTRSSMCTLSRRSGTPDII